MAVRTHHDIEWDAAILAVIATLRAAVNAMQVDVTAIRAVTDAEGVLEETGGVITSVLATEVIVYVNNAPAGVFVPKIVRISTGNHTATETITIREYHRNESGGGMELYDWETYAGAIAAEGVPVHLDANRFGVEITLELDAGTPQAYTWEGLDKV